MNWSSDTMLITLIFLCIAGYVTAVRMFGWLWRLVWAAIKGIFPRHPKK